MGVRRKSRELAVQALYRLEVTGDAAGAGTSEMFEHFDASPDARVFAAELVRGVLEQRETIDRRLEGALENWSIERLSRVDVNVLRVGVLELLRAGDVPTSVVLDEAIEVARRFGGDEAAEFVNGVLDAVADELGVRDPARPARRSTVKSTVKSTLGTLVLVICALFLANCGYHFAGTGTRMPEDVQTLSFGPITNSTREVGLEKVVREALEDEISSRGRLEVVSQGQGDVILSGTIGGYDTIPAALNDRGEALQYKTIMLLSLELRRRANGKLLWKTQDYRVEADFSAVPGVVVTSSSRFQKSTLNSRDLGLFTDIQLSEGQRREANERLVEDGARELYNQMMEDF